MPLPVAPSSQIYSDSIRVLQQEKSTLEKYIANAQKETEHYRGELNRVRNLAQQKNTQFSPNTLVLLGALSRQYFSCVQDGEREVAAEKKLLEQVTQAIANLERAQADAAKLYAGQKGTIGMGNVRMMAFEDEKKVETRAWDRLYPTDFPNMYVKVKKTPEELSPAQREQQERMRRENMGRRRS